LADVASIIAQDESERNIEMGHCTGSDTLIGEPERVAKLFSFGIRGFHRQRPATMKQINLALSRASLPAILEPLPAFRPDRY
jgi:hypothetical protein